MRNRISIAAAGGFFLLFFWISCSTAPRVVPDTDRVAPWQLIEDAGKNHFKKTSLQASGSISIESRDFTNSGSFTMSLKQSDSLLIRLRGPFGINVGTVFLSHDLFFFYNSLTNEAIIGEPRHDIMRAFLRMDMGVDEIMNVFFGSSGSLFRESGRPDEYSIDRGQYMLVYRSRDSIRRYWIDPYYRTLTRVLYSSADDHPLIEERYDRFTEIDGKIMARSIRIISHQERATFAVSYNRINLNSDNLSFSYSIPSNAKIRDWREE